jgi:hypothetical protein
MASLALTLYKAALLAARRQMAALDRAAARAIIQALERFAAQLGVAAAAGADPQAIVTSQQILQRAAEDLARALERATTEGRSLSFTDTQAIWKDAMLRIARAKDIPTALVGGLRLPPVTMLGQFESLNASRTWQTLIRGRSNQAAAEAAAIVRQAIAQGMSAPELARRLRRYVLGAEPFQDAFQTSANGLDLNQIPPELRGAARTMRYNAERIAFTEIHNARGEAEIQHFRADPFVGAVQWTLSPDRGSQVTPDQCDILAGGDFFGLGPGIYPVNKVPAPPHPFDRCERRPVPRAYALAQQPKPNPSRLVSAHAVDLDFEDRLTPAAAARIRALAEDAIRFGELASAA